MSIYSYITTGLGLYFGPIQLILYLFTVVLTDASNISILGIMRSSYILYWVVRYHNIIRSLSTDEFRTISAVLVNIFYATEFLSIIILLFTFNINDLISIVHLIFQVIDIIIILTACIYRFLLVSPNNIPSKYTTPKFHPTILKNINLLTV